MAVITYNTSTSPMALDSVFNASPVTPTIIASLGVSSTPQTIPPTGSSDTPMVAESVPVQVIGLVPVFPCCAPSTGGTAGFGFAHGTECGSMSFQISINAVSLGVVIISDLDNDAAATAAIQALLPAGYTCLVVSSSSLNRIVTIFSPNNGDALIVQQLSISCSGSIISFYDFTSNAKDNADCAPDCDCRDYPADTISNDEDFVLPVFASGFCMDAYHNDSNSFLFQYRLGYNAITEGDFVLQVKTDLGWEVADTLNDDTYGTPYANNFFNQPGLTQCTNFNYQGYKIDWRKVFVVLGVGLYRFCLRPPSEKYCFNSPAFCLREFECAEINGTVKFETEYSGGTFGSITTQGQAWQMCCTNYNSTTKIFTAPVEWTDSVRFAGFFGRENYEKQRDFIKYATGEISKVRDELVKTFDLRTDRLPLWLHQRLAAYAFMADRMFVSDYNDNNSNYNYKHFWIVDDSGYSIDYKNYTRMTKIKDMKFKEGRQLIFKDRCC